MTKRSTAASGVPDFLTVEEAGVVLRVGRNAAYRLAREYIDTNGASGLHVVRYGKQLRVPRAALERDLGAPISWPIHVERRLTSPRSGSVAHPAPRPRTSNRRRSRVSPTTPQLFS